MNDFGFMLMVHQMLFTVLVVALTFGAVAKLHVGIVFFGDATNATLMDGGRSCGKLCRLDVSAHLLGVRSPFLILHEPWAKEHQEV